MTTKALATMGLHLGPKKWFVPGNEENPNGFHEFLPLSEVNRTLLRHSKSIPGDVSDQEYENLTHRVGAIIEEFPDIQAFKDPRTSILLPFWKSALPKVTGIVKVWRNPIEIGTSLAKRGSCDPQRGQFIANLYEEWFWRGVSVVKRPVHVVSYAEMFRNPVREIEKLMDFVNRYYEVDSKLPEDVAGAIDPTLYRCKAKEDQGWFKVIN
jgi:hypothetical protein